jgi:hypothetical protein
MTIAEIHGKISQSGSNLFDCLEDLLTSDVFTACKYLRPKTLLIPFLARATSINNENLSQIEELSVKVVRFVFWPRLDRSEPDVLISIESMNGDYLIILVEAKYLSSKSSIALNDAELEIAETPRDQLAREYLDLTEAHKFLNIPKEKVKNRFLIYLTAHRTIPYDALVESYRETKRFVKKGNEINLYWLSWFELLPTIKKLMDVSDWEEPILNDLKKLLERKRLIRFNGYRLKENKYIQKMKIYKNIEKIKRKAYRGHWVLLKEEKYSSPVFYLGNHHLKEYQ